MVSNWFVLGFFFLQQHHKTYFLFWDLRSRIQALHQKICTFKDLQHTRISAAKPVSITIVFEKKVNHLPSLWSSNQNQLVLLPDKYLSDFLLQRTSIHQKWCIFNTNSNYNKQCILCAFQLCMRKVSVSVLSYNNYLFLISILAMTLHSVM